MSSLDSNTYNRQTCLFDLEYGMFWLAADVRCDVDGRCFSSIFYMTIS